MTKKNSFKAMVFDLDGTLLDTLEDIKDSVNAVLNEMGLSGYSSEQYRYFVGQGMKILSRRVLPEKMRREPVIKKFAGKVKEEYGRRWADRTKPYDGIPEALDHLSAMGISLNVLSNKPEEFVKPAVDHYFKNIRFARVLGSSPGRPNKPDPAGALHIAGSLSLSSEECAFIGDTHTDMETAVAAGMFPVGVLWGFRTEEELKTAGAAEVVRRPEELLSLLR